MIGKIKKFNFESLLILNTFALIVTSYFFNNFIFTGFYILFFFISIFTTKNGLKIIKKFSLLQNIRNEGPANHFKKSDTPTMGGIFMIIPFLIFLLIITINLGSLKLFLLLLTIFGFFITGFFDDYLNIKNKENYKKGIRFENHCMGILKQNGWEVKETPNTGDQGVDLIASINDLRICIQCKDHEKAIGNKAVQEISAGKLFWKGTHAVIVSKSGFTKSAHQLAKSNKVELINEYQLKDLEKLIV